MSYTGIVLCFHCGQRRDAHHACITVASLKEIWRKAAGDIARQLLAEPSSTCCAPLADCDEAIVVGGQHP